MAVISPAFVQQYFSEQLLHKTDQHWIMENHPWFISNFQPYKYEHNQRTNWTDDSTHNNFQLMFGINFPGLWHANFITKFESLWNMANDKSIWKMKFWKIVVIALKMKNHPWRSNIFFMSSSFTWYCFTSLNAVSLQHSIPHFKVQICRSLQVSLFVIKFHFPSQWWGNHTLCSHEWIAYFISANQCKEMFPLLDHFHTALDVCLL